MKKLIITSTLAFIAFSSFVLKPNNEDNLKLNAKVSSVEWIGKKVTGQHTGTISIMEGNFHVHEGKLESGNVTINMESISSSDLKGEWAQKLIGHLKSPDFFNVANHKTSSLEIKKVKLVEGNNYEVDGELTIKGITKAITFPTTIEIKDGKLAAYSEISVDRTLYDIKYGSGKFFDDLGDKMIDDNFIIKFKIAAE